LGDFLIRGDLLRVLFKIGDNRVDREIDAALQIHRIEAGGNCLGAFPDDRSSEDGRRGRAVAGGVVLLRGSFADKLNAEIFELIGEFDLFCNRYAVLGDSRRAIGFLHDCTASVTHWSLTCGNTVFATPDASHCPRSDASAASTRAIKNRISKSL
jgi:hypothetical protein